MRIPSFAAPRFTANAFQPQAVNQREASKSKPFLSVQPGDIFVSMPTTQPVAPESLQAPQGAQPQFAGRANLRVRAADQTLAQAFIRKLGNADNALLAAAAIHSPKRRDGDDLSTVRFMQAIINANADVNYISDKGISPLLAAVLSNNLPTASLLLEHGANVNLKHHYQQDQRLNLAGAPSFLIPEDKTTYPILETRSLPMLQLLLKHGADVNVIGQDHKTQREFSAFDRLGLTSEAKMKLLTSAKPKTKPVTVAFRNKLASVRPSLARLWITGSQAHQLHEIQMLLTAGAIPNSAELDKLDALLKDCLIVKKQSDRYIPYYQSRINQSSRQLLAINAHLIKTQKKASLEADRLSDSISDKATRRKLNPVQYLQILQDCQALKESLQKGGEPLYAVTQLAIMRQNNKVDFKTIFNENGQLENASPKRTFALAFPNAQDEMRPHKRRRINE